MALQKNEVYRARAIAFLQRRIMGHSFAEIAKEFKCSEQTVIRSMQWVKKEKIVESYERSLLNLVPEAIKVYEDKLINEKDPYVAKDLLDKLVKLGDRYGQQLEGKQNRGLAAYLQEQKLKHAKPTDGTDNGSIIDITPNSIETVESADFEEDELSAVEAIPQLDAPRKTASSETDGSGDD